MNTFLSGTPRRKLTIIGLVIAVIVVVVFLVVSLFSKSNTSGVLPPAPELPPIPANPPVEQNVDDGMTPPPPPTLPVE